MLQVLPNNLHRGQWITAHSRLNANLLDMSSDLIPKAYGPRFNHWQRTGLTLVECLVVGSGHCACHVTSPLTWTSGLFFTRLH